MRDEKSEEIASLKLQLAEICELVGPGGDGTAFGRVESMLCGLDHEIEELRNALGICYAAMERHDIESIKQHLPPKFTSELEIAWKVLYPDRYHAVMAQSAAVLGLACDCPYRDGAGVGNDHLPECPAAIKGPHEPK